MYFAQCWLTVNFPDSITTKKTPSAEEGHVMHLKAPEAAT